MACSSVRHGHCASLPRRSLGETGYRGRSVYLSDFRGRTGGTGRTIISPSPSPVRSQTTFLRKNTDVYGCLRMSTEYPSAKPYNRFLTYSSVPIRTNPYFPALTRLYFSRLALHSALRDGGRLAYAPLSSGLSRRSAQRDGGSLGEGGSATPLLPRDTLCESPLPPVRDR